VTIEKKISVGTHNWLHLRFRDCEICHQQFQGAHIHICAISNSSNRNVDFPLPHRSKRFIPDRSVRAAI